MDLDDVSNIPQYVAVLQQQKANFQRAQAVKGRKATPKASRDEIIGQFMLQRSVMTSGENSAYNASIRCSFIPPAYLPSVVSLRELRKIKFRDLSLETHHCGQYILVRTVTPSMKMTATMAIIEDEDKRVFILQLFNRGKELPHPQDLPEGAVLAVKEPYVKVLTALWELRDSCRPSFRSGLHS